MVCHSLRHDGEELLTQRDGVEGYVRTGRWMGVPLLHPWANRLAAWDYEALGRRVDLAPLAGDVVVRDRKTGLPIHGVLPRPWDVLEARAGPARRRAGAATAPPSRSRTGCASTPSSPPRRCGSPRRSRRSRARCRSRSASTRGSRARRGARGLRGRAAGDAPARARRR